MLRFVSLKSRYAAAVVAAGLAFVPYAITGPPAVDSDLRCFGFAVAVLACAIVGGFGPGLVTTALSALLSAYFLLAPVYSVDVASGETRSRLLLFMAEGILLSCMGQLIRDADASEIFGTKWKRYAAAAVFVATAVAVKLGISWRVEEELPFSFFYAATALSAWAGGVGPGAIATVFSAGAAKFLFMEPRYSLAAGTTDTAVRIVLFTMEGLIISYLGSEHPTTRRLLTDVLGELNTYGQRLWRALQDGRALKSISRDVLWEWDLSSNPVAARTIKSDAPETPNTPMEFTLWLNRIHPKDRLNVVSSLRTAVEEGQREWFCEYRRLAPTGGYVHASDHAYIIRDAAWNAVRVIGRSADVTDAKRAPAAFKSTGTYRAVFDSNPVATLLVDSSLHIIEANESACDLFGYSRVEMGKLHIERLFGAESRGSVLHLLLGLEVDDGGSMVFEGECRRADGELFRARVSGAMILENEHGAADRIMTVEEIA